MQVLFIYINQILEEYVINVQRAYGPSVISDDQMIKFGKEAMDSGVENGNIIYGYASNGLRFEGYIDSNTGEISNFYPTIR